MEPRAEQPIDAASPAEVADEPTVGAVTEPTAEVADEHTSGPAAVPAAEPMARPAAPANESVAAALAELESVGQRPLAEHPEAFERVRAGLQQALADIDDA